MWRVGNREKIGSFVCRFVDVTCEQIFKKRLKIGKGGRSLVT